MTGASILGSKNPDYLRSPGPEMLEIVEFSFFRSEYMDNNVAEVQQHPSG